MTPAIDPHDEDATATIKAAMRAALVYSGFLFTLREQGHSERTAVALTIAYIQANGFAPEPQKDEDERGW